MSGVPVAAGETSNSRRTNQTTHPDTDHERLSADQEELDAEESLSIYCKPIEFYNFLRQREIDKPLWLQRCLDYKMKAKRKRIQMTVILSWKVEETETIFPLYICLARQFPNGRDTEYSAVYRISRIFIFRDSNGTQVQAKFKLPEAKKLAEVARSGSLYILVFTTGENPNSTSELNASLEESSDEGAGEYCLSGKTSLESLYMAWTSSNNFTFGQRAEMNTTVELLPCTLKYLAKESISMFQAPCKDESTLKKLQLTVSAEEYGAKARTLFHEYVTDVSSPRLSRIIRLRNANVVFYYRYHNNTLKRIEVTEDFTCAFCLVRCGSYKGLRYHLFAFHDLFFNFDFAPSDDQAVTVSLKTDVLDSKIVGNADPKSQTFIFCAKPLKRRKPENLSPENSNDADPMDTEPENFGGDGNAELLEEAGHGDLAANIQSHPHLDHVPLLISESDRETPRVHQVSKIGQIRVEPDHATPAGKQVTKRGKLPVEPDHGTLAVQQVAKNGKLPIEPNHETPAVQQVAKKGILPVEPDRGTPTVQHVTKKWKLPSEPDHGTPTVQQVSKNGKLPVEPDDETLAVQQSAKKGRLPVEPNHETPTAQQVAKKGKLSVKCDRVTPTTVQQVSNKANLLVEPDHGTPAVQQVAKIGKLPVEADHETLVVQQVSKKGMLSVEPDHETPTMQQVSKKKLSVEHDDETPEVQQVSKEGNLPVEPDHEIHAVQQVAKKGKLPVELDHGAPAMRQAAKKGKLSITEPNQVTPRVKQAAKKGKLPAEPDNENPTVKQKAKKGKGKLSDEHSDPQSSALLSKRQFYHSRRYQPMSLEEVLSDHDSEIEVDNDIIDIEDRTLIDNFDMTKNEKDIILMWNTFIRRQHVLIDSHIPWACKAFSSFHAPVLVQSPELALYWRVFMIKLWNHNLLHAETMNECNIILEEYQKQNSDPQS